jgi:hypothetical protein
MFLQIAPNIVIRKFKPDFILLSSTTNSTIANVTITNGNKGCGNRTDKCVPTSTF